MQKFHRRYKFPHDYDNLEVKNNAMNAATLMNMSTRLSNWRTRVKKQIDKNQSWEEIKKHKPLLEHGDYLFKEELETNNAKAWTAWGKRLRDQNIGNHILGSGGYRGIKHIWVKEDAEIRCLGKPNMFDKFKDGHVRNFVRAYYFLCPITKEFKTTDSDVLDLEKHLEDEIGAEACSPTTRLSEPWDTPFNRAVNIVKKRQEHEDDIRWTCSRLWAD